VRLFFPKTPDSARLGGAAGRLAEFGAFCVSWPGPHQEAGAGELMRSRLNLPENLPRGQLLAG